jgi:phage terminase small subunit
VIWGELIWDEEILLFAHYAFGGKCSNYSHLHTFFQQLKKVGKISRSSRAGEADFPPIPLVDVEWAVA